MTQTEDEKLKRADGIFRAKPSKLGTEGAFKLMEQQRVDVVIEAA